jgi:hypothetical protein
MMAVELDGVTKEYPAIRKGIIGFRDIVDGWKGKRQKVIACKDGDSTKQEKRENSATKNGA